MVKGTFLLFSLFTLATAVPVTIDHATVNGADAVGSALNKRAYTEEEAVAAKDTDQGVNSAAKPFEDAIGGLSRRVDEQAATSGAAKRQGDLIIPVDADVPVNVNVKRDESSDDGFNHGSSDDQAATSGAAKRQGGLIIPIDADVPVNVNVKRDESSDARSDNGRSDE
ncbi:hypothetical protein AbraIFM66950_001565 [Aspergillus brasiliensis]|nr:hypothetical protein AbraIFM66950_001565 [Aspergillus brasiliensis]